MNLQTFVFKTAKIAHGNYWESYYENFGIFLQEFHNETNKDLKEKIYKEKIEIIFDKMTENIIDVYGFGVRNKTKRRFKYDCVRYMKSKISRFDVTKPEKAFPYFNVISKGWLCYQYHVDKKRNKGK